jgi:GLPGLI family protein
MKHVATALLFTCALVTTSAVAQQGKVIYEETVKLEIELPPEMADMKDKIPSSQSTMKQLLFNEQASLLTGVVQEKKNENHVMKGDGLVFKMQMQGAENETYTNFEDETAVEKIDFMGRTFLVEGSEEPIAWKMTTERSEFLGYLCMKATAMRDSTTLEAWFTPEIPVPAGPDSYGGLPGLVLVLNIDDGQRTFVAKELSLEELPEGAIAAPKKGKRVTREEYDKIVEDKMKEMGAERAGRGGNTFHVTIKN